VIILSRVVREDTHMMVCLRPFGPRFVLRGWEKLKVKGRLVGVGARCVDALRPTKASSHAAIFATNEQIRNRDLGRVRDSRQAQRLDDGYTQGTKCDPLVDHEHWNVRAVVGPELVTPHFPSSTRPHIPSRRTTQLPRTGTHILSAVRLIVVREKRLGRAPQMKMMNLQRCCGEDSCNSKWQVDGRAVTLKLLFIPRPPEAVMIDVAAPEDVASVGLLQCDIRP
jgi:hypothetical protein